ncbi:hypothetical protein ACGFJ5_03825 [Micromonospora echinaurantiaca]|uniref:hypothetical protein n=1 Tax=Micromonospora echinaurantiaca TaxID=47857 RepID=UPI00371C1D8B
MPAPPRRHRARPRPAAAPQRPPAPSRQPAPHRAAPRQAGSTPGGAAGAFNPTDVAWLQLHVAMTDRMLPVLDVVPAGTGDPAW